jgi:hypothetical protein
MAASTLFSSPLSQRALACVARTWHDKIKGALFIDLSFASTIELPCSVEAFKVPFVCHAMPCLAMQWAGGGAVVVCAAPCTAARFAQH